MCYWIIVINNFSTIQQNSGAGEMIFCSCLKVLSAGYVLDNGIGTPYKYKYSVNTATLWGIILF